MTSTISPRRPLTVEDFDSAASRSRHFVYSSETECNSSQNGDESSSSQQPGGSSLQHLDGSSSQHLDDVSSQHTDGSSSQHSHNSSSQTSHNSPTESGLNTSTSGNSPVDNAAESKDIATCSSESSSSRHFLKIASKDVAERARRRIEGDSACRVVVVQQGEIACASSRVVDFFGSEFATTCLNIVVSQLCRPSKSSEPVGSHTRRNHVVAIGHIDSGVQQLDGLLDLLPAADTQLVEVSVFGGFLPDPKRGKKLKRKPQLFEEVRDRLIELHNVSQKYTFVVRHWFVGKDNTFVDEHGHAQAKCRNIAVDVATGEIFPHSFRSPSGPALVQRSTLIFCPSTTHILLQEADRNDVEESGVSEKASRKPCVTNVGAREASSNQFKSEASSLSIPGDSSHKSSTPEPTSTKRRPPLVITTGPYWYSVLREDYSLTMLHLTDESFLHNFSTSPHAEDDGFCERSRDLFRYMLDNPYASGDQTRYRWVSNGKWSKLDDASEE